MPLELFATALGARLLRRDVTLVAVGVGPFYSPGRSLAGHGHGAPGPRTHGARCQFGDRPGGARRATGRAWRRPDVPPSARRTPADERRRRPRCPPRAPGRGAVSLRRWYRTAADGEDRQAALRDAVAGALPARSPAAGRPDSELLLAARSRGDAGAGGDPRLGAAEVIEHELDWAALTAAVGDAGLVVAMRYHAVAAAAMAGRPIVAMAYEPKVRALSGARPADRRCRRPRTCAGRLTVAVTAALADPGSARPDPVPSARCAIAPCWRCRLALGPRVGLKPYREPGRQLGPGQRRSRPRTGRAGRRFVSFGRRTFGQCGVDAGRDGRRVRST